MPSDSDLSCSSFYWEFQPALSADTALAPIALSADDRALLRQICVVLSEVCLLTQPGAAVPEEQIAALRRMLLRADLADLLAPDTRPPADTSLCGLLSLLCDSRLVSIVVRLQVAELDLMDADDLPALYEVAHDYLASLSVRVPGLLPT